MRATARTRDNVVVDASLESSDFNRLGLQMTQTGSDFARSNLQDSNNHIDNRAARAITEVANSFK